MAIFSSAHTQMLQEVIREIETDPATYLGAKYMPSVEVPSAMVHVDVWEARGGLTKETTLGADPQSVNRRQFRTQSFSPAFYKEFIRFGEADILRLRELGQNDQSKRGIRQHLNEGALMLNNRIEARIELLRWQAILNGSFIYDGKTIDFGRPSGHDVSPTAPWGANDGSGHFTTVNTSAVPLHDIRYWTMGGYAPFRKYKITKMVMNPNTARMFIESTQVQSYITSMFANASNRPSDPNTIIQMAIPGAPPLEIYNGWYQPESQDATTGQITVGDAVYFIPDGRIFFEAALPDGNKVGDFAMTLNLSNGDIDAPAAGKFVYVDETNLKPGSKAQYVDVVGGVYGGPRLKRGFDLLTATVI